MVSHVPAERLRSADGAPDGVVRDPLESSAAVDAVRKFKGRIGGTINDEFEVDVEDDATEEQAREAALESWRYVEFEDLEVTDIEEVTGG